MFLFYWLARDFGANDVIVESGVGYGGSTSFLARLFPMTPIMSVDTDRYGKLAELRRSMPKNVTLRRGDSRHALPAILRLVKADRIAALIDGPKRRAAIHLTRALLTDRRVRFVAVHDLPPELTKGESYSSHNPEFREACAFLDERVGEYRKHYPNGPGLHIFRHA